MLIIYKRWIDSAGVGMGWSKGNNPEGSADSPARRSEGPIDACEGLLDDHDALDRCVSIEPRLLEDQYADLQLRFGDRAWLRSAAGEGLIEALREQALVDELRERRADLLVRFDGAALAELEKRLAGAESAGMETADILAGASYEVSLVGPNANKALHLGHFRNVAIGQALASMLAAAGASVRRRSLVADIGRRFCEAMGGYRTQYQGQTPESLGVAGDRFVEQCSRAFPQAAEARSGEGPNAREEEACGDLAETILQAWLRGEEREMELSRQMREWVLTGQERTLARLGVEIDEYDFESEEIPRAFKLIEAGLERGLFEQEENGTVVFRTGRPEYATMVLLNDEGAPTECARVLAVCHRLVENLDPTVHFWEVLGDEWRPAQTVVADLLVELLPSQAQKSYEWLYYGLVTEEGQKMGSSNGEVVWIDDFLDQLASSVAVGALEQEAKGRVNREDLADLIARGSFLFAPMAQPLPLAIDDLLEGQSGAGWTIARAWCRAQAPTRSDSHPAARAAVMQSQQYRRALRQSLQRRDPVILAGYLVRLSEACLAAPESSPAARPVLQRVLASLGFTAASPEGVPPDQSNQRSLIEV